jgi:hypothetical protein
MLTREPCATPTETSLVNERIRWFTGRYLSARDLTDEQHYHLARHRLHNRLFHPHGIVCGLEVKVHKRHDCASTWVWVEPGVAVDCLGREIIVDCQQAVEWPLDPSNPGEQHGIVLVRYAEQPIEPAPAFVTDDCNGHHQDYSRIAERWEFTVATPGNPTYDCWAALCDAASSTASTPCCEKEGDQTRAGCLDPSCTCDEWLPLAVLKRCGGLAIEIDESKKSTIRPTTDPPPQHLTRITNFNWPHGGQLSLADLEARNWQLQVTFSRPVEPMKPEHPGVGVSSHTFLVEIEDSTNSRERLDHSDTPFLDGEGCTASFTIDEDFRKTHKSRLVGDTVFVTIFGDLIHACNGLPVDADYFGSLPSGDGRKGGVFRSWFEVTT